MLRADDVHDAFIYCLVKREEAPDGQPSEDAVLLEGISLNVELHKARLEEQREKVLGWIDDIPEGFLREKGGGWTFLNLTMTKQGDQWCEQPTAQALMLMAMGLGYAQYQLPRDIWRALPGGVPYVVFSKTPFEKKDKPAAPVTEPVGADV